MSIYDPTCGSAGLLIKCAQRRVDIPVRQKAKGGQEYPPSLIKLFPKGASFPGGKADWGWVQIILASLKPQGRAAVVLDTGAASRGSGNANTNKDIAEDAIRRIADTFSAWKEVEKYSRIVSREEIAKNDFNISPSRYIHTGAADEYRPLAEIVEELDALEQEARETDKALKSILGRITA